MCLVHVFHGLLKYTLNSYLIFYNSLMAAYIPTVKGRKTMGLCFRPKPAREQQVLVLKTTFSDVLPRCEKTYVLIQKCTAQMKKQTRL